MRGRSEERGNHEFHPKFGCPSERFSRHSLSGCPQRSPGRKMALLRPIPRGFLHDQVVSPSNQPSSSSCTSTCSGGAQRDARGSRCASFAARPDRGSFSCTCTCTCTCTKKVHTEIGGCGGWDCWVQSPGENMIGYTTV